MKPLPINSTDSSSDLQTNTDRRPWRGGYLLVNLGGWLLFGVAMMIGWLDVHPWAVVLATTPVYILIGFFMSLLLGLVYQRLGVGSTSFARSLALCVAGSTIAGVLWNAIDAYYQLSGAVFIHSLIIGAPSTIAFHRGSILDGALVHGCLPLFGWSLVYLGAQFNNALREEREIALRAVTAARDAQLRMLAYQLNPHFLFNTLNSIRALINEDRQRARDMVTALSGYLRYALVERPLHVALLEEEVASVRGYLSIEQVRFENRLNAQVDVEPAALKCEVPAFLLNPLVENAVRHGAGGTTSTPLAVRIEGRLVQPDRLRLVVENSGNWKPKTSNLDLSSNGGQELPGGLGLANVRARLAALYPEEHRIDIEEANGCVRVMVELPARRRIEAAA